MATQAEYALLRWMLAMYDPSNGSPSAATLPVATASAVSSASHGSASANVVASAGVVTTGNAFPGLSRHRPDIQLAARAIFDLSDADRGVLIAAKSISDAVAVVAGAVRLAQT